jgi:hypothetical protein
MQARLIIVLIFISSVLGAQSPEDYAWDQKFKNREVQANVKKDWHDIYLKIYNTPECARLKELALKLEAEPLLNNRQKYLALNNQYSAEVDRVGVKCVGNNSSNSDVGNEEKRKAEAARKKIEEEKRIAGEKRIIEQAKKEQEKNKKDIAKIGELAKGIDVKSKQRKTELAEDDPFDGEKPTAKQPLEPKEPEPDPKTPKDPKSGCEIKGFTPGCLKVYYTIRQKGLHDVTKDMIWHVAFYYVNECDGYVISALGDLSRLVYDGDPYVNPTLAAKSETISLSRVNHFNVTLNYSAALSKIYPYLPMQTPKPFCRLALAPGEKSDLESFEVYTPPIDCDRLTKEEQKKAMYLTLDDREIKIYNEFIGLKRRMLGDNGTVRISYEMKPTGSKPFEGKFMFNDNCTEPSIEYTVNVYFENVSGKKLRTPKFLDNPGLGGFQFMPPQYTGPLVFESNMTVPSKPISLSSFQTFAPMVPSLPDQELKATFNTWVHQGVPRGFQPHFNIGTYFTAIFFDTTNMVKPALFFAYVCKGAGNLFIGQGKNARIKAADEAENSGCLEPIQLFKSNKKFVAIGKALASTKVYFSFGESDASIEEANNQVLNDLKFKKLNLSEPIKKFTNTR